MPRMSRLSSHAQAVAGDRKGGDDLPAELNLQHLSTDIAKIGYFHNLALRKRQSDSDYRKNSGASVFHVERVYSNPEVAVPLAEFAVPVAAVPVMAPGLGLEVEIQASMPL